MLQTKAYDNNDPLNTLDAVNLKAVFGKSKSKNALKEVLNAGIYSDIYIVLDKEWNIHGVKDSVFQLGFKRREQLVTDAIFYGEKIKITDAEYLDVLQTLNTLGFKDLNGFHSKELVYGEEIVLPDLENRDTEFELK